MKLFRSVSESGLVPSVSRIVKGFSAVVLACAVVPALGMTIPVMTDYFDTAHFDSNNGEGITYISTTGNYAIVDSTDDTVYIVDPEGILQDSFDISGRTTSPTGISFSVDTGLLAVTDDSQDEVFFFDLSGSYQSQFDTAALGSHQPEGITYDPGSGNYAILDRGADAIFYVTPDGTLQGSCVLPGITSPSGIAYNGDTGYYAVVNTSTTDIHILNSSCIQQDQFDTAFVASTVYGVTWNPVTGDHVIVEWSNGEVFSINGEGSLLASFSTVLFGSSQPSGISFVPPDRYAIVDNSADKLFIVDSSGSLIDSCSVSGFSTNPTGVAYAGTGEFAIADATSKKIFFIDSLCNPLDEYRLRTFGILPNTSPTGISIVPPVNKIALSTSGDVVKVIDPTIPGRLRSQFSTAAVASSSPSGIVFIASSGNYVIVDWSSDNVFVVTPNGQLRQRFPTKIFSTSPTGIAFDSVDKLIAIVDQSNDQVYLLDMPVVDIASDPPSCAGDFNQDGDVDGSDLAKFSSEFGRTNCPAF